MGINNDNFEDHDDDDSPDMMDEHEWEALFRESDRRTDNYIKLLEKYRDDPDRDKKIEVEMGWNKPTEEEDESKAFREAFWKEYEEFEQSGRWKKLTGYEDPEEMEEIENLPVYQKNFQYSLEALKIMSVSLTDSKDSSVQEFRETVLIPAAKIAGGFGMGFDAERLGGNIANCKRGLTAANRAMDALYDIGQKGLLDRETYLKLQQRGKEARDELALYILELRRRFEELRG
ncbi:MAG: hypothetical protein LAT67_14700 [Balneolales bacterium]|nr:hypothetical protein [Balneolales bacterium]